MDRLRLNRVALLVGAVALAVSLFLTWREAAEGFFGSIDQYRATEENGWERWTLLDIALALLAAAFVALAAGLGRLPQDVLWVVMGGATLAVVCILVSGFDAVVATDPSQGEVVLADSAEGPVVALAAIALGIVALIPLVAAPRADPPPRAA